VRSAIFLSLLPFFAGYGLLKQITVPCKPNAGRPSVVLHIRNNRPVDNGAQAANNLFMSCGNDAKPGNLVEFNWSGRVRLPFTIARFEFE
jgi:hypothetical protein